MKLMEVTGKIMRENEDQTLAPRKIITLIESETFTEAETVALQYLNSLTNYTEHTEIASIKKCDYSGVSFNETITVEEDLLMKLSEYTPAEDEGRFYELICAFEEITESGKPKITKEKFIVPAESQIEAIQKLDNEMREVTLPHKVVNGKETPIYSALLLNDIYKIAKQEFDSKNE